MSGLGPEDQHELDKLGPMEGELPPESCAWIVITELDGFSTYVGVSRAALQDVRASPDVEASRLPLDAHMDPGGCRPRWR